LIESEERRRRSRKKKERRRTEEREEVFLSKVKEETPLWYLVYIVIA
jgi:hypothetical protein